MNPSQTFQRLLKERCWVGRGVLGQAISVLTQGCGPTLRAAQNLCTDPSASGSLQPPLPAGAGAWVARYSSGHPNGGQG